MTTTPAPPTAAAEPETGQPAAPRRPWRQIISDGRRAWTGFMSNPLSIADVWRLCSITGTTGAGRAYRIALFTLILICPAGLAVIPARFASRLAAAAAADEPAEPTRLQRHAAAAVTWLGFDRQPVTVAEARRRSWHMDLNRVPAESDLLAGLWYLSNRTDRRLLLALIPLCPAGLVPPLLYIVERPTRRLGTYLILWLVTEIVPALAKN